MGSGMAENRIALTGMGRSLKFPCSFHHPLQCDEAESSHHPEQLELLRLRGDNEQGSTITGDEEVWEAEKEQAGPPCSCHLSSVWMAPVRCWHCSAWQQTRLTACLCPNMLQGTCEGMTVLQNFDVCEVSLWIAWFCSQLDSVVSSLLGGEEQDYTLEDLCLAVTSGTALPRKCSEQRTECSSTHR